MKDILVTKDDYKRYRECLKKALVLKNKDNFDLTQQLIAEEKISVFFDLTANSSASKIDPESFIDDEEATTDISYANAKIMDDDLWRDENEILEQEILNERKKIDQEIETDEEIAPYPGESIQDGNEVGQAAREYYQLKYGIERCCNLEIYSRKIAPEKTAAALQDMQYDVYFEPTFISGYLITKCDVLIRDAVDRNSFHLVEVKASSGFEKDRAASKPGDPKYKIKNIKKEHLWDISYQYYVLREAGINLKTVKMMYLDNTYVREGDLNYDWLFCWNEEYKNRKTVMPLIEYCQQEALLIPGHLEFLHKQFNNPQKIFTDQLVSQFCDNAWSRDSEMGAEYCKHIVPHVPKYNSVFNLYRGMKKKTKLFYVAGFSELKQLPWPFHFQNYGIEESDFNIWQQRQIEFIKGLTSVIDSSKIEKIQNTLKQYQFPIYMYDFETMKSAIPMFDYTKSYQQIPFQYSVHILKDGNFDYHNDNTMEHHAYLADGSCDPRLQLIENMVRDLSVAGPGTYVAYYKSFECSRLQEMHDYLQQLIENQNLTQEVIALYSEWKLKLLEIKEKTIDLMDFFHEFQIYKMGFNGSTSIKKTLPAFEPTFTYDNLKIRKGDMASETFRRRAENNIPKHMWDKYFYEPMLIYCNQDTKAMVAVYQAILAEMQPYL